ncbi:SprT-like family-domain-containing protein, partial [Mycena pura]
MPGTPATATPLSARRTSARPTKLTATFWDGVEVVPDSEEERERERSPIDISSGEEDWRERPNLQQRNPASRVPGAWPAHPGTPPSAVLKSQRTLQTPAPATPLATPSKKNGISASPRPPTGSGTSITLKKNIPSRSIPGTPSSSKKNFMGSQAGRARVTQSMSDNASDDEIVQVFPFGSAKLKMPVPPEHFYGKGNALGPHLPSNKKSVQTPVVERVEASDSDVEVISGPVPVVRPGQSSTKSKSLTEAKAKKRQPLYEDDSDEETSTSDSDTSDASTLISETSEVNAAFLRDPTNKYAKYWTPGPRRNSSAASKSPSKKKLSAADVAKQRFIDHLTRHAEQVYSYLNKKVFKDGLPSLEEVELKWTNILLTTAGKAYYHRDRSGQEFAVIYLARKVLDTEEKLGNTLSHEMCHLATWIIDGNIKESHGSLFQKWADRVQEKDQDITISHYHTYEIIHPWTWGTTHINIMGRWSNSLVPEKTRCSACKTGKMVPLDRPDPDDHRVVTRSSKHAAARSQSSPRPRLGARTTSSTPGSINRSAPPSVAAAIPPATRPSRSISSECEEDDDGNEDMPHLQKAVYIVPDSESEEDGDSTDDTIAGLTKKFDGITIVHNDNNETISDLAKQFDGITIAHKVCLHARLKKR